MNRSFPPPSYRLLPADRATDYIQRELLAPKTPFVKRGRFSSLLTSCLVQIIRLLNWVLGTELLVENADRELSVFDKSSRRLLASLMTSKVVVSWDCKPRIFHLPHWVCSLTVGQVTDSHGRVLVPSGRLKSHGIATDVNEALIIALAEAIERVASSEWEESALHRSSLAEMIDSGRPHIAPAYIRPLSQEEEKVPILWSQARNLQTNAKVYLPASMVYIFYRSLHLSEPQFVDPSSNAVAAHTSMEAAALHAIYEALERDGFLMYWLNKLSPQNIDPNTLPDEYSREIVDRMRKNGFSVYLLDCKTEYGVPIVVSVTIHDETGRVSVNAAAGLEPGAIIKKVALDTLRWNTAYKPKKPDISPSNMTELEQREQFWYGGYMRSHIDFFISGPSISYEAYEAQFDAGKRVDELEEVKGRLAKKDAEIYVCDLTNDLAKRTGLFVVRAVIPQLLPVYFVEAKKHLNLPRLRSFPRVMGLADADTKDLNESPHPFI